MTRAIDQSFRELTFFLRWTMSPAPPWKGVVVLFPWTHRKISLNSTVLPSGWVGFAPLLSLCPPSAMPSTIPSSVRSISWTNILLSSSSPPLSSSLASRYSSSTRLSLWPSQRASTTHKADRHIYGLEVRRVLLPQPLYWPSFVQVAQLPCFF